MISLRSAPLPHLCCHCNVTLVLGLQPEPVQQTAELQGRPVQGAAVKPSARQENRVCPTLTPHRLNTTKLVRPVSILRFCLLKALLTSVLQGSRHAASQVYHRTAVEVPLVKQGPVATTPASSVSVTSRQHSVVSSSGHHVALTQQGPVSSPGQYVGPAQQGGVALSSRIATHPSSADVSATQSAGRTAPVTDPLVS